MKVFVNGHWYDSNKLPIVLKLDHIERLQILQMDVYANYYGSFPEPLSEKLCVEVMQKAKEKDVIHENKRDAIQSSLSPG